MSRELNFFFFIGSTYTYLAVNRAEEVAAQAGVALRWRPFNLRVIMKEQDNIPFVGKPAKMQYMWRDLERRANGYAIPFRSIPAYPVDPDGLANRVAVVSSLEGWCPEFTRRIYRSWFLEGGTPGDVGQLRGLLSELGRDPDATIERADSDEIQVRFAVETGVARQLGIFGSPTFAAGPEIFWGDDRLEDAIAWAKAGN
jgi:2-hydroxychromene-2-carboxylate isomerase